MSPATETPAPNDVISNKTFRFDYPGSDVILRSSPVLRELLRTVSNTSRVSDGKEKEPLPVVKLSESGAILHSLLTFVFPVAPVAPIVPSTTEEIMTLLSVVQKYQMDSVLTHIRDVISLRDPPFVLPETVLHVYYLAQKNELHQEVLRAARSTFRRPMMVLEDLEDEVDFMPGARLRELWKYYERVRRNLASSLLEFRRSGVPDMRMSCLRRLELNVVHWLYHNIDTGPPASAGDVVPLSKLTHLIFSGRGSYLLALVVGLAAPSLQRLDVDLYDMSNGPFLIPRLCGFIHETGFYWGSLGITSSRPISFERMAQELSAPLSTVEELIVVWDIKQWYNRGRLFQMDQWRGFRYHVPQVKKVRVSAKLALDVAHSFQQEEVPIPNLLPALERVEVLSVTGRDDLICDAFEPLITARERAGRPVRLSWTLVDGIVLHRSRFVG
ncbi:hypothetical protein EDB87DRAFT_1830484 [Lactarius vividus]|nr:hypothetical protein EDB87DRAFT_1830484 [Lactarius vividus]